MLEAIIYISSRLWNIILEWRNQGKQRIKTFQLPGFNNTSLAKIKLELFH